MSGQHNDVGSFPHKKCPDRPSAEMGRSESTLPCNAARDASHPCLSSLDRYLPCRLRARYSTIVAVTAGQLACVSVGQLGNHGQPDRVSNKAIRGCPVTRKHALFLVLRFYACWSIGALWSSLSILVCSPSLRVLRCTQYHTMATRSVVLRLVND